MTFLFKQARYGHFSIICVLALLSCQNAPQKQNPSAVFANELSELQSFFQIPGLSAMVTKGDQVIFEQYSGMADLAEQAEVSAITAFPIASITKLFSATLIMRLVEQGQLSLDDPISKFLPEMEIDDKILVKHLLSHTSQGKVGEQFYYSFRFGLLTQVIEKASGRPFKTLMEESIFQPLNLNSTFLLKDSAQLAQRNIPFASPYILDDGVQEGFIDYGYSTSAGVVSTPADLMQFSKALDNNILVAGTSKNVMYQGLSDNLPYAYGLFRQQVEGVEVLWVYGQYDCYSSLLLKVPSKNLTLVLLANNNLMSDPARLIMGDVTSSLFAMSFLKNYVFDLPKMPLLESPDAVYAEDYPEVFYRKKVMAQALAESFMARFDTKHLDVSTQLVNKTLEKYPDYLDYGNINLMHNLTFLKDVAFYRELGQFSQFDPVIEALGNKLLSEASNNPYVHSYLGNYFDRLGNQERAAFHFKSIVNAENFSRNWYTNGAMSWLKEHQLEDD